MSGSSWRTRLVVATLMIFAVFAVVSVVDLLGQPSALDTARGVGTETTVFEVNDGRAVQALGSTTLPSLNSDDLANLGTSGVSTSGQSIDTVFEPMRNAQPKFARYAGVPSLQLGLDELTEPAPRNDNGPSAEGQFRIACEYSHFSHDDPIIYPGDPGKSHFHMFFGNTDTTAFTTEDSLINTGGSSCQGFELNRSAYWVPALLDGRGNAVAPYSIIIYYKTKSPETVIAMPQGLQMIGGNDLRQSFETSSELHWSCGGSGNKYNMTSRIPDCGGDTINASVQFPNCWDGANLSKSAPDFTSHLTYVNESQPCPDTHPQRLPQISFLLYFRGAASVDGWHLASDDLDSFGAVPGGSLHADWWGGWNDEAIALWTDNCLRAARNCSFGQTGTPRQLASLNDREQYEGPNYLPIPQEG